MANLTPSIEIQGRGWMADETEAGYQRVSRIDSDLVFQPLMSSMYNTSITGTATVSQQSQTEGNPFGTMDGLLITVPAGSIASPQSAAVYFQFMGRKLSLAWDRFRGSNPLPVTGWVDGKFFSLDNTMKDVPSGTLGGNMYANMVSVPVTLKDDGPHQCKLYFPMDLAGGVQRQWLIYGYGVEGRFGVTPFAPSAIRRYLSLTTSFQSVVQGTYGKGIRKLQFVNMTSGGGLAPVTVTIETDSNVYPAQTIAAGGLWEYDFGEPVQFNRSSGAGTGVCRVKSDTAGTGMYIVQRMK